MYWARLDSVGLSARRVAPEVRPVWARRREACAGGLLRTISLSLAVDPRSLRRISCCLPRRRTTFLDSRTVDAN